MALGQEVDDPTNAVREVLVAKGEAEASGTTGAEGFAGNDGHLGLLKQRSSEVEGGCLLYTSPSPRD